jgi:ketosteroid isomerase-like protein
MSAKELARRIYQCFGKGDLAGVLDTLSEDVVWELVGPHSIPYFGRYSGRDGVKDFFAALFENEEILEFLPEQFIGTGDTVAVIGRERCRAKRTGREFSVRWV